MCLSGERAPSVPHLVTRLLLRPLGSPPAAAAAFEPFACFAFAIGGGKVEVMGAVTNAGAPPDGRCGRQSAAGGMGVYELVRSDESAGPAADLEAGGRRSPSPPKGSPAASSRQRLVSLDVFRGITVLVCPPKQISAFSFLVAPAFAMFVIAESNCVLRLRAIDRSILRRFWCHSQAKPCSLRES